MNEYKVYVGCKIIKANPMSKGLHETLKKGCEFDGNDIEEGYRVTYEDGYVSWSPKDTFDRCYREITIQERNMVL